MNNHTSGARWCRMIDKNSKPDNKKVKDKFIEQTAKDYDLDYDTVDHTYQTYSFDMEKFYGELELQIKN